MTTLQEKENEIRKKMRQRREEFRIYMKIYKEMELEVDRITLDEGPKEKMKGQQKDAESPSFPFSIESKDVDQWAEREKLTPETVRVLKEEGFDSLEELSDLTSADIDTLFINTNLLIKQQCLRLKRAVERLNTESSQGQADSGHVASSAAREQQVRPTEKPKYSAQDEAQFSFSERLRFLLVGKTGVGKSTTGNTILGDKKFRTSVGFSSETSQCELHRGVVSGLKVEIVDSPGLFDTSVRNDNIAQMIVQAVTLLHPGPHAFLFVVKIGRFTQEEEGNYKRLIAIFDKEVTKYMIVVFTGGDNLRSAGKTFDDVISLAPTGLQDILKACGGRYVVFDNMAADKKPQVNRLFQIVLTMVNENINKQYTCPQYISVGEEMEEEIQKRMIEAEKREIEHKEYIKQLEMKNKVLEEVAKKAKDELEMRKIERQKELKEQEEIINRKIQQMTEQVEQKLLTETEMKKEEKKLLNQKEDLQKKFQKKLEEDTKKMEEDEKKRQIKADQAMEEMKKWLEKMEQTRKEEMNKLKDKTARNEERGLLGRMADEIADQTSSVYGTLHRWFPF